MPLLPTLPLPGLAQLLTDPAHPTSDNQFLPFVHGLVFLLLKGFRGVKLLPCLRLTSPINRPTVLFEKLGTCLSKSDVGPQIVLPQRLPRERIGLGTAQVLEDGGAVV